MNDDPPTPLPVWTLSTAAAADLPTIANADSLTPARLSELRTALAAISEVPLVTLEAHPLAKRSPRSSGITLDSTSPLAAELSRLVSTSVGKASPVALVAESGDVLYRMVVPAKMASQFGKGLVKPMASRSVPGGVYSGLVDSATNVITSKATFVPVEAAGAAGAAGAVAGTATAGTALTVAAPLVLMAVAVGASAYADQQRQKAIEHITELLEKLHDDRLDEERGDLEGCHDAIDGAPAILMDRGEIGASLGLDSAVHEISTATATAFRRTKRWEDTLDRLPSDGVDLADLEEAFPGISEGRSGEFGAHLELAALAIALKRRVILLQGVAAGQSDEQNPFEHFVRTLRDSQERIDELEERITNVLLRISSLQLRSPNRLIDRVMTRKQVDELLKASYQLRALNESVPENTLASDVVIEIEQHRDGTLLVLPAHAA